MSTYVGACKKYYDSNKDEILAKEKENKRWKAYYERNRDAVKKRNLEAYHRKKAAEKAAKAPEIQVASERLEKLIAEMKELMPIINPRKRKVKNSPTLESTPAPDTGVPPIVPV
jgi:hypothetical protein